MQAAMDELPPVLPAWGASNREGAGKAGVLIMVTGSIGRLFFVRLETLKGPIHWDQPIVRVQ